MCDFKDERTVQVCDVAIDHVRRVVHAEFGDKVRYTTLDGEGTLVRADADVDADAFGERARAAIAAAQQNSGQ
ncbi:MAG: hypothetical protein NVSMB2_28260 [Chloroflexota bacterium]